MKKYRAEAFVDLSKIKHNYEYIKNIACCRVMAVVKADAYGHGAKRISSFLQELGVDFFAVACIDEAVRLRKNGIKGEILIFGVTGAEDAKRLRKYNLIQTVGSKDYARSLSEKGGARVHLKIDTGMSRLGIYLHSETDITGVIKEIKAIKEFKNIQVDGIYTHFANADKLSSDYTEKQYTVFSSLLDSLNTQNIDVGIRHCCNSAAILNFPHMKLDMVRAGIILYGLMPSPEVKDDNLIPAMTFKSRVVSVSNLKKGDCVSYGCTYTAEKDMKTAVISIGYADGFSRALSEKVYVKINGKKAKIIGKICMDLCVADISGIECKPGDQVIIFENAEDINNLAKILGTINYEIVCILKQRVMNTYKE